ncbi:unnamed protein product [Didymodactylos carnosus]|uniref:Ubiquitin thioesterase OTU n=1 Tax=Didymodactylos carnosus TaxID=1234261 RepID=A0A814KVQ1_9BILA|nr:unnamed protein product [Didymodactylos carnosus]CAF3825302.1 unnamed protein product [Didymodactylos carnosus]
MIDMTTTTDYSNQEFVFVRYSACEEDGSCLFDTIRKIINNGLTIQDYRNLAAEKLKKKYSSDVEINGRPRDEYCQFITQKGSWGGADDLQIFAEHFLIDFRVLILTDARITSVQSFGEHLNNLIGFAYLLYDCDKKHYDPLILFKTDGTLIGTVFENNSSNYIESILQDTFIHRINSTGIIPTASCFKLSEIYSSNGCQNEQYLVYYNSLAVPIRSDGNESNIIMAEDVRHESPLVVERNDTDNYVEANDWNMGNVDEAMEQQEFTNSEHIVLQPSQEQTIFSSQATVADLSSTNSCFMPEGPEIIDQPNRYQYAKYLSDLARHGTFEKSFFQNVQSGPNERGSPGTTIKTEWQGLYMEAAMCTHDEKDHPSRLIPEHSKKDANDKLIIPTHPDVIADISNEIIKIETKSSTSHKKMIIDGKLNVARIAFTVCERVTDELFVARTKTTYSSLMKLGFGEPMPGEITKRYLCDYGGEKIEIPFSGGRITKADFELWLNGKKLDRKNFKKPKNSILLQSPAQTSNEQRGVHILLRRENLCDSVEKKSIVYDDVVNIEIPYVKHQGNDI